MEKHKILREQSEKLRNLNNQITNEILTPDEEITKSQERQILKLKVEKYKTRAEYFKTLKDIMYDVTKSESSKQDYDKIIKKCKDTECRTFYLSQSKRR